MVYRTPGREPVLRGYEYKLTREEVIEAITKWLESKGEMDTPDDATTPGSTRVLVKSDGNGMHNRSLDVKTGRPLRVMWEVLEGEEP